jgi:hypothetical protein
MEAFRFRSSALDGCNVFMSEYEDMLAWVVRVHTTFLGCCCADRQTNPNRLQVLGGKASLCFDC